MKSVILTPLSGWNSFTASPNISGLIDKTLDREKSGDRWRYFGFTSDTSIWQADETERNVLYIEYEKDLEKISKLVVQLTECDSPSFQELKELKEKLISEFGLKEEES